MFAIPLVSVLPFSPLTIHYLLVSTPLSIVQTSDSTIYGITQSGGKNNAGTIFSYTSRNNVPNKLFDFKAATQGMYPIGNILLSADQKIIYGATSAGGTANSGTLFSYKISTNSLSQVFNFTDGAKQGRHPGGNIILVKIGTATYLMGMTNAGGAKDSGAIFRYDIINNADTVLWSFDGLAKDDKPTENNFLLGAPASPIFFCTDTASNNSPIFLDDTLKLMSTGGVSFQWTGPNGFSSTQQNPVISHITIANAGTYRVMVTNAVGCSAMDSTDVTIIQACCYNAGPGITISGNNIINTAPDQVVTLTGASNDTISGTYPNFTLHSAVYNAGVGISISGTTITNTAPGQAVTLTVTGNDTLSGSYPNFTLHSAVYNGANGISVSGTTITNTAPDQVVTLTGASNDTISGTYPNFTIHSTVYNGGNGIECIRRDNYQYRPRPGCNRLQELSNDTISGTYPNFTIHSTVYNGGNGISVSGGIITNTAPDQVVTLSGASGITVSGSYPNFVVGFKLPFFQHLNLPTNPINAPVTALPKGAFEVSSTVMDRPLWEPPI